MLNNVKSLEVGNCREIARKFRIFFFHLRQLPTFELFTSVLLSGVCSLEGFTIVFLQLLHWNLLVFILWQATWQLRRYTHAREAGPSINKSGNCTIFDYDAAGERIFPKFKKTAKNIRSSILKWMH